MDYQLNKQHYVRCLKCLKILKCSRYDTVCLLEHIRTDHPEIECIGNKLPGQDFNKSSEVLPSDKVSNTKSLPAGAFTMPDGEPTATPSTAEKYLITEKSLPRDAYRSQQHFMETAQVNETPQTPQQYKSPLEQDHAHKRYMDKAKPAEEANIIYKRNYNTHARSQECMNKKMLYRTSIEKWRPANGSLYCPKCGTNRPPLIKTRIERNSNNSCGGACILSCWPFCFIPYLCPGNNKEYLHCSNCKNFLGLYDPDNNCVRPNRDYVTIKNTYK